MGNTILMKKSNEADGQQQSPLNPDSVDIHIPTEGEIGSDLKRPNDQQATEGESHQQTKITVYWRETKRPRRIENPKDEMSD